MAENVTTLSPDSGHGDHILALILLGACRAAEPTPPTPTAAVAVSAPIVAVSSKISLGAGHACLLDERGGVACLGDDDRGVLGRKSPKTSDVPLTVAGLSDVKAVAVGMGHTCALRSAGTVACWGLRNTGQLGDGQSCLPAGPCKQPVTSLPADVPALQGVTALAAGGGFTCAVRDDKTLVCFGSGLNADLVEPKDSVPVHTVAGIDSAVRVVAGGSHACVLEEDQTVACLGPSYTVGQPPGENPYGGLGATPIAGLDGVVDLAAGLFHTCAVRGDGSVWCWGSNTAGDCGSLELPENVLAPVRVPGVDDAVRIAAGYHHACALHRAGGVTCWGSSTYHVVPKDPKYTWNSPPTAVPWLPEPAVDLVSGGYSACVEHASGARTCWGDLVGPAETTWTVQAP